MDPTPQVYKCVSAKQYGTRNEIALKWTTEPIQLEVETHPITIFSLICIEACIKRASSGNG